MSLFLWAAFLVTAGEGVGLAVDFIDSAWELFANSEMVSETIYSSFADPPQCCWTNHVEERGRDPEGDPMSRHK